MPFRTITGNIFDVEADAIVIPEYSFKKIRSRDISAYQIAGRDEMRAARNKFGEIAFGCCEATPAFGLKAKYALHTAAPSRNLFIRADKLLLIEECYISTFALAKDLGVKSIVFPLLGDKIMPAHKAAQVILALLDEYPIEATLVLTPSQQDFYENSISELDELYTAETYERIMHYENICAIYRKKVSYRNECKIFQIEQAKRILESLQAILEVYRREIFVGYIKEKVGKGKKYTQQEFADLSYIDVGNLNRILKAHCKMKVQQ